MSALKDKVAIVTGASSGIGRAAAMLFAAEGAKVVVGARRAEELERVVAAIAEQGGEATAVAGDVGDEAYAQRLVARALERYDRLDVAFNNAGTLGAMGPVTEIEAAGWHQTVRVNLDGAFYAAKHQAAAMSARGGAITFTSTFVGHTVGFSGMAAYAASKAGVVGLTKALASELGPAGIRVNALLPGGTDTPMGRAVASSPEALAHVRGLHALGRIADPIEIARAALFLASDASSFVTGAAMLVDGGVSIHR